MVENNFFTEINLNKKEIISLIYISFVVLPVNQTYLFFVRRDFWRRGTGLPTCLFDISPPSLSLIMNFSFKSQWNHFLLHVISDVGIFHKHIDTDARSLWVLRGACANSFSYGAEAPISYPHAWLRGLWLC